MRKKKILIIDKNLIKESQIKDDILNKNQELSDLINQRECEIEEINNDNNIENNNINNINNDISSLDNTIEKYKNHIIHLTDINELLSKELRGIIQMDEQMRNNAFDRIQYLKGLKEDNKNIINESLKNITNYMQTNGNKGCYIITEKTTDSNQNDKMIKNKKKKKNKNKNKFFSFKDKNTYDNEE